MSDKWIKAGPSSIPENLDIDNFDNWAVEDFPIGMVGPAGNGAEYYTGGWRHEKPVWQKDLCKNCMLCWINCADTAVFMENQTVSGINYHHCKGCGVCPIECRFGALKMVPEHVDHLDPAAVAAAEGV
ncbi:MAG: ferredoxin [Coriobacteriia bacterium]|nr:ferredoxin [Coriobacteriia bacterium]